MGHFVLNARRQRQLCRETSRTGRALSTRVGVQRRRLKAVRYRTSPVSTKRTQNLFVLAKCRLNIIRKNEMVPLCSLQYVAYPVRFSFRDVCSGCLRVFVCVFFNYYYCCTLILFVIMYWYACSSFSVCLFVSVFASLNLALQSGTKKAKQNK